jgi:hypothetical protein
LPPARLCFAFLVLFWAVFPGCETDRAEPRGETAQVPAKSDAQPGSKFAMGPKLPDGQDDEATADVIIKSAFDRYEKESYRMDDNGPAGHVRGACRFAGCPSFRHGPPKLADVPVDLAGANAVLDPKLGELDYYRGMQLAESRHIGPLGDSYGPTDVVLIVHGVKAGRRPPLQRPVLTVKGGVIRTGADFNYSLGNVQFAPVHERVQFFTWDAYPCRLVMTHAVSGEVFFETNLAKPKEDVESFRLSEQSLVQSPILRKTGLYVVSCKRHPWQKAYVFVVDNPYVAVSNHAGHGPSPLFLIENLPLGRYRIEAWNPLYKPVTSTMPVEVKNDVATEVMIDFECPAELKNATEASK